MPEVAERAETAEPMAEAEVPAAVGAEMVGPTAVAEADILAEAEEPTAETVGQVPAVEQKEPPFRELPDFYFLL